jgi:hypothetical protein
MNDFEVHNIGTFQEIKLSRELANAIEKHLNNTPLPSEILQAYLELRQLYNKQIQEGIM